MFLDRVVHFGENLGDQVKGRSPKKIKSLIVVLYVAHLKVQVLSFCSVFLDQVIHYGKKLGDFLKSFLPKRLKSLI